MYEELTEEDRAKLTLGLESRWSETAPGERTHYLEMGSGEPVLLVHGSGPGVSAATNWSPNIAPLAERHRVIAPDLIGFGQSTAAEGQQYGISSWVEHLVRLLDHCGVERSWLVGNSLGGWVGLELAIRHPDRVNGIISMGTGGAPRPAATKTTPGTYSNATGMRQRLERFVVDTSIISDDLLEARRVGMAADGADERFNAVVAGRDADREEFQRGLARLRSLDLPVLLIHGIADQIIPLDWSINLAKELPRSDLVVLTRCGHWTQIERAGDFNAIVGQFIDNAGSWAA
jgi:2-hydroxymuconate-semialdehyde hydrolase